MVPAVGTTTVNLTTLIGNVAGVQRAYINPNGSSMWADTYGLTQRETWLVDYGDGKRISGKGKCSSQVGDNNNTWTNPTISSTLPDSSGKYCYCQLDVYTTTGANWGAMESLSAPWVTYRPTSRPRIVRWTVRFTVGMYYNPIRLPILLGTLSHSGLQFSVRCSNKTKYA